MTLQDIKQLLVNELVITKTIQNSVKKYLYTIQNTSYSRTPIELLDNIFMGDFAKNLMYDCLINSNVNIKDYDEIRTDNFQDSDKGWDLKVGKLNIEVKSSTIPSIDKVSNDLNKTFQNILKNRDIKIYAKKCNNCKLIPPKDLNSDIFIQIYFPNAVTYKKGNYKDPKELYKDIQKNPNCIKDIINIKKYFKAYYFGYLTKEDIKNIYDYNIRNGYKTTWSFPWTEAIYWKAPLSKAKNLNSLIYYLTKNYNTPTNKTKNFLLKCKIKK